MLTISSSSLTPASRRPVLLRRHPSPSSNELYRPRTILIQKPANSSSSYGFSIQTYGFASLNPLSNDESASSLLSLSSESTESRQSSASNSLSSATHTPPIQLVTYVDHVQDKSSAWEAGLRAGSVILSVNDQSVEHDDHEALVKRITESSTPQLKLIVVQQNVNKQIALCEQLQKLHKQLHEKQEEFNELCKQEIFVQGDEEEKASISPSPRLEHISTASTELTSSFCHNKIPLDWRQSVTNFAHQQKLGNRVLPTIVNSSSSISSSKYAKTRPFNRPQQHQRSMSLSTFVFHYSKSSFLRHHSPLLDQENVSPRRALSYEDLIMTKHMHLSPTLASQQTDESMIASGCSLAMDLSRSFDLKKYSPSSSSSSSTTIDTDAEHDPSDEKINQKIKQLKWKLRINK